MERLKDEFVSTVSHEPRTPLTSIAGSLGLLVGSAASELPKSALRLIGIAAPLQPTWKRVQDAINHGRWPSCTHVVGETCRESKMRCFGDKYLSTLQNGE
jgi:signal transduction histidine kinase